MWLFKEHNLIAKNLLLNRTCKNCHHTDIGRQVETGAFVQTFSHGFSCLLQKDQKYNTCREWRHMQV